MIQEPAPETGPDARWKRLGGWLLIAVVFALGFINFPLRIVGESFEYIPGDGLDNRLNNYILEHGYRYLSGREISFWNAPAFYPSPGMVASSDAHLGMLPLYAFLRVIGLTPECAFQGWFVIPFALNYAASLWALRRLGAGYAGMAAGAFIFAFGLPIAGQFGHAQLLPRFLVPPAAVFGWEFLRSGRTISLFACCACVVYQIYISIYIGYFLVLLLAAGLLTTLVLYKSQLPWDRLWRPGKAVWYARSATIALSVLALVPLGWAHSHGVGSVGADAVRDQAPTPEAWITPPKVAILHPLYIDPLSTTKGEHRISPGFVVLGALALALCATLFFRFSQEPCDPVALAAWSAALLMLVVTVCGWFWPYRLLAYLPGGDSIRAIGRIVMVLLFPLAVVMAGTVDALVRWAERFGKTFAALMGLAAIALVVSDQWISSPYGDRAAAWVGERSERAAMVAGQDRLKEIIMRHPSPTLVYAFPTGSEVGLDLVALQLETMRASQDLGVPCVNGFSGYFPGGWDYFKDTRELMTWLENNHVPPERIAGLVLIRP